EVLSRCVLDLGHYEKFEQNQAFFEKSWTGNSRLRKLLDPSLSDLPFYAVVPLMADNRMHGVVQIFAPREFEEKYNQEGMVLNTLATQAAVSLDNVNYYNELKKRARIQSELEIAHDIQKRFTPRDPAIPGFKVKGVCLPANEMGGDYLDYFQNKSGDWVLVIADVCGKGIPAALVMTSLRSTVRSEAQELQSSKKLLCKVNEIMLPDLQQDGSFITCICLVINREGNRINYTHAGHPMLVKYRKDNAELEEIQVEGIALGILDGKDFETNVEQVDQDLKSGDRFLAYTDGLVEAMNEKREIYGKERLLVLLDRSRSSRPGDLVETILKDMNFFSEKLRRQDDLTLFALEKL
ncbi:GAF domain-containing SpoIIE family protein phosphatase, partial [Fibrobacterota bacterium]